MLLFAIPILGPLRQLLIQVLKQCSRCVDEEDGCRSIKEFFIWMSHASSVACSIQGINNFALSPQSLQDRFLMHPKILQLWMVLLDLAEQFGYVWIFP